MAREVKLCVKIIASDEEKVIGWKGDVLEIGLQSLTWQHLFHFLLTYLSLPQEVISLQSVDENIYTIVMHTKHIEDVRILFA